MDRRQFCGAAVATALSEWLGAPAFAMSAQREGDVAAVVFDARHPASRAYAERLSRLGARRFATVPDIPALWRGPLGDVLAQGGDVSGLTTYADFVVARSVARDFRLRPILAPRPCEGLCLWAFEPRRPPARLESAAVVASNSEVLQPKP